MQHFNIEGKGELMPSRRPQATGVGGWSAQVCSEMGAAFRLSRLAFALEGGYRSLGHLHVLARLTGCDAFALEGVALGSKQGIKDRS